jgi:hypothetical protein
MIKIKELASSIGFESTSEKYRRKEKSENLDYFVRSPTSDHFRFGSWIKMATSTQRRPVGGHAPALHTKDLSTTSVTSNYSQHDGYSHSPSYSHASADFEGKNLPALPRANQDDYEVSPLTEDDPTTPQGLPASPTFGVSSQHSQSEIWRRRSTKSERSIGVTELKLSQSNGSTVGSPSKKDLPPPPERSLPPLPAYPPRSGTSQSIRKPLPQSPVKTDLMGNSLSRSKGELQEEESGSQPQPILIQAQISRPPTPEYGSQDATLSPYIVSPLSPETPPQEELPPQVPSKSPSRENLSSAAGLRKALSKQSIISTAQSRGPNESLDAVVNTSLQPPSPQNAEFVTPLQSPTSPNAKVSPFVLPSPVAKGIIVSAPPLNQTHFDCYQKHRFMRRSPNVQCPVACMICEKKDTEKRWLCNWCCLRCCDGCMATLARTRKDLKKCLQVVLDDLESMEQQLLSAKQGPTAEA